MSGLPESVLAGAEDAALISSGRDVRVRCDAADRLSKRRAWPGVALVAEGLVGEPLQRRRFRFPFEAIGSFEAPRARRHGSGSGDQMA